MNKNFSKKLNMVFSGTSNKPEDKSIKITIDLPSDKLATVTNEIYQDLLDSDVKIIDKELYNKSLILTISGDVDKDFITTLVRETCEGNDIKTSDYNLIIE